MCWGNPCELYATFAGIASVLRFAVVSIFLFDLDDLDVDEGSSTVICYVLGEVDLFRNINISVTAVPISGESISPVLCTGLLRSGTAQAW